MLLLLDFTNTFPPDSGKRQIPSLYPHAKGIVHALNDKGIAVAIASRSPNTDTAKSFLDKLGLQSMFAAQVKIT